MDSITLERRSARNPTSRDEMEPNMARRLWHVVRAVLFMLRKGVSKRKLAMDLNLLLQRGKIAGKSLSKLMNTHHDKSAAVAGVPPSSFSWRAADPALAVYNPRGAGNNREVEFSCSNTPSYSSFTLIPTGGKRRRRNGGSSNRRSHRGANGDQPGWYNYDAADIARVFEILNNSEQVLSSDDDAAGTELQQQPSPLAVVATLSPALWASFGRTPAHVKQLRITDSPFPVRDDASSAGDAEVDLEAEEFIKRFYEQLRKQQSLAGATPDCGYSSGYARPVTGMA
ncbi:hypothetical protein PR202_gb27680 [Eleusine coracana subsp. coracana]|uniref:Avr9/Cf-9 rapidly elicited protein 146 n=1 Tax=Eleusine coracana subsp. coracana TaxID=191504 RepID=A0AAV5FVY7_ELECO|nr:hypothetical protein QOZ80_6AG0542720 [Eleusine coracana subsp. coracana]GJN38620.1 hypothetical protein PR202_gb27680 [Eleusine coracana subsp. coracana]